jgi:hypothetical protein
MFAMVDVYMVRKDRYIFPGLWLWFYWLLVLHKHHLQVIYHLYNIFALYCGVTKPNAVHLLFI